MTKELTKEEIKLRCLRAAVEVAVTGPGSLELAKNYYDWVMEPEEGQ